MQQESKYTHKHISTQIFIAALLKQNFEDTKLCEISHHKSTFILSSKFEIRNLCYQLLFLVEEVQQQQQLNNCNDI